MSDIHKALLRKVKRSEEAFGLTSLVEGCEYDSSSNNTATESTINSNDTDLFEEYTQIKLSTFPVTEKYEDPRTRIKFQTYFRPPTSSNSSIFVCHHGAGSSSMTFAKLATTLIEVSDVPENGPGLFTFDMRGHGCSSGFNEFDLESLSEDFNFILETFCKNHSPRGNLYFLGHSLGGAVLTNYLVKYPKNSYNIKGLIMLDIVEETAVRALKSMPSFIDRMPKSFNSYKESIHWHINHIRLLSNYDSAKISVPDLLTRNKSGILEWKTDLRLTTPFWNTWFKNLSKNFIESGKDQKIAKLLMLSGHETLDTNLIIGQMQGKYQLIVFNNICEAGHFIHEDIPEKIAISLIDFVKRNDSPNDYMKKELGFVPKWGGKINK